ncbi:ATP-binding cassette domain-containing protein [Enterococcus faecalis]
MIIEAKNLFISRGDKPIIAALDLAVDYGEFIIISRKSGSGKTTLINNLSLLEHNYQGELTYFNQPLKSHKMLQHLRRNHISYLFQNYGLLNNLSVYENLKLALNYNHQIKKAQLPAFLEEFGLNDVLSKKVVLLSGGEQQRVALLRSLLKPYDILFADEPTGNLDQENTKIIIEHLQRIVKQQQKAVVMVTHDPSLFRYGDRVIDLSARQEENCY